MVICYVYAHAHVHVCMYTFEWKCIVYMYILICELLISTKGNVYSSDSVHVRVPIYCRWFSLFPY